MIWDRPALGLLRANVLATAPQFCDPEMTAMRQRAASGFPRISVRLLAVILAND
jgi:hypothetical protein